MQNNNIPYTTPYEPAPGSLLLLPDQRPQGEKTTASGLLIVEQTDKPISSGRLMAGESVHYNTGDRLAYSPYAGYTMNIGGIAYIQLLEGEILGRLKDAEGDISVS